MTEANQLTVLHFVHGKYQGKEYPLDTEGLVAGRSTEADLVLADDAVSRKHARFFGRRGRVWVRDLGSRNGTIVNGDAVSLHCLRAGDRLAIGSSLARVDLKDKGTVGERAGEKKAAKPAMTSGRSMTGSIEEIPLMDVLQWLATSRKTGALKVSDSEAGTVGALHLRAGQVFYAAIEGSPKLHPQKALLRMLMWQKGSFELENQTLDEAPVELSVSLEHMLMEAARQQDELANLTAKGKLPADDETVKLVSPSTIRWKDLEESELELLQDIVELGGWDEVLETSERDDVALFHGVIALKKRGVVEW